MNRRLVLVEGSLLGLLALILIFGGADTTRAGSFNPSITITFADPTGGASSDTVTELSIPRGDVNFAGIVAFIPREFVITPGDEIPIGTEVGRLTSTATLGLINAPCNNPLPVEFTMLNASIDTEDTVTFDDLNGNNHDDVFDDRNGDFPPRVEEGLFALAVEKYPEYINRLFEGNPTPIRRAPGTTVVAGVDILLHFVVYEPGTFISSIISNEVELGYPSVTLLQDIGDPEFEPVPGVITDFCTPLETTNSTLGVGDACVSVVNDDADDDDTINDGCPVFGQSEADVVLDDGGDPCANAKNDDANDDLDASLAAGLPEQPRINDGCPQVGSTSEGDIKYPLIFNPGEGTYTFTTIAVGQRDADGDGIENSMDTCDLVANLGDPRIKGDGDLDEDGLDAACDPNDDPLTGGTSSDEDLDGYLNRQDNCPLVANGEIEADIPGVGNQLDSDVDEDGDDATDQIGDACDPNPDTPDGELLIVTLTQDITITGDAAPPPTGDGGGDDDGGGSGTLIIIIVVIAAVVVVGGGAFYFMRRGGGGAAT